MNDTLLTNTAGSARIWGRVWLLTCGLLAAFCVQATSPTEFDINGNTITFNYPDWYQVQNSTDYTSLCEGNLPCTVPDGEYIVINHTINERFIVTVGNAGLIEMLALPDDGWYQVQNAQNYKTICEGVSSCAVGPGKYIVINHTTGVRMEKSVPSSSGVTEVDLYPSYSDFVVEGKRITFTASGWFQVQYLNDYQTVCEGVESCEVTRYGYHQVINFTTGERWTDVFIGEDFSSAQCLREGGVVVGDPGDGSVHQPEYRCESGQPPLFTVFALKGEPIAEEGAVCCR